MKKKSELKLLILILGILFALSTINNYNFSDDQENIKCIVEIQEVIDLKHPKNSGAYFESFIHIDGNWSDAIGKGWFSGDGSWGNPYTIENISIDAGGGTYGILINNSKNDYFTKN